MTLQWTQELSEEAARKIAADIRQKATGCDWDALDADEKKSVLSDIVNVVLDGVFEQVMSSLEQTLIEENNNND